MLDFGFDEGGNSNTLLVSLQIGSSGRVRSMNRHWKKALDEAGVPFFHSKDFSNFRSGVFTGLGRPGREALLHRLVDLIHRYLDVGITAHVDTKSYDSSIPQPFKSRYCSAFTLAFYMAISLSHKYLAEDAGQKSGPANILVAQGHRNMQQVLERAGELTEKNRMLAVKTCGAGDARDWPILQAADMLAYGEWQKLRNGNLQIFDALHREGHQDLERQQGTHYLMEGFECGPDDVERLSQVLNEEETRQRVITARTPKPNS